MTAPAQGDGPAQPPQQRGADGGEAVARVLDPGGELRSAASDCVHCGFCLPACPTYQLWGEEMDSPRGRIHLITQILESGRGSQAAAEHFDRCLGCMACVTACPSGVQYDQLIEAARAWADDGESPRSGNGDEAVPGELLLGAVARAVHEHLTVDTDRELVVAPRERELAAVARERAREGPPGRHRGAHSIRKKAPGRAHIRH